MGEKRRFLDRVLKFMGIEDVTATAEDPAESQEPDGHPAYASEPGPERRAPRASTTLPSSGPAEPRIKVLVRPVHMEPLRFNDVQSIADRLINRDPVVVSVERLDKETAQRVLDFLGGTTYALGGHIQKMQDHTFLLTPGGVEVDTSATLFVRNRTDERPTDNRRGANW